MSEYSIAPFELETILIDLSIKFETLWGIDLLAEPHAVSLYVKWENMKVFVRHFLVQFSSAYE